MISTVFFVCNKQVVTKYHGEWPSGIWNFRWLLKMISAGWDQIWRGNLFKIWRHIYLPRLSEVTSNYGCHCLDVAYRVGNSHSTFRKMMAICSRTGVSRGLKEHHETSRETFIADKWNERKNSTKNEPIFLKMYGVLKKYRKLFEILLKNRMIQIMWRDDFIWCLSEVVLAQLCFSGQKKVQNRTKSSFETSRRPLIDKIGRKIIEEFIACKSKTVVFNSLHELSLQYLCGLITRTQRALRKLCDIQRQN